MLESSLISNPTGRGNIRELVIRRLLHPDFLDSSGLVEWLIVGDSQTL